MNYKISRIFILAFCLMLSVITSAPLLMSDAEAAAQTPVFDASFDGGKGALFANGTPIAISQTGGKTIVSWPGGSSEVPPTAKIFGGGASGTFFDTSKIKMESGTVSSIYGGGFSVNAAAPAVVGKSEVIINSGTVTASAYAGGLLYTKVSDAAITVNDGTASFVVGGGAASATVDGVNYNTGTEADPKSSGTIVEKSTVTINNGEIYCVFGGGQGYSNTVKTDVIINSGNIQYVTAGGSNGYTGSAEVLINGGRIDIVQSVNRGTVDSAEVKMLSGTVGSFFIGSEDAEDATGKINKVKTELISGAIGTLNAGKNNNIPLVISKPAFDISYVGDIIYENNIADADVTDVKYQLVIENPKVEVTKGGAASVKYTVKTTPAGYEGLFANIPIKWSITDEQVATVSNGNIIGVNEGSAIVSATLINETSQIDVSVTAANALTVLIIVFSAIIIIAGALWILFRN